MDKSCFVIINPAAGHGKAREAYPQLIEKLKEYYSEVQFHLTKQPKEAIELAREAAQSHQHILCMGGDGTSYEVLNGLMEADVEHELFFGTIPLGTGNSFLLDFDIDSKEEVLHRISMGQTRKVDIVKIVYTIDGQDYTRYFRNIVGTGLIADICKATNEHYKFAGEFGYTIGTLMQLMKLKNEKVKLTIDGETIERNNSTISLSNSKYTGGKMLIAPMAEVDDGYIDIIMINDASPFQALKAFLGISKGSHVNHPKVETLRGKKVKIEPTKPGALMIDGEVEGRTPIEVEVLPRAISIYA